jgi:hypothetical protein
MAHSSSAHGSNGDVPPPPSERGPWLLAIGLGAAGVAVLVAVLSGAVGGTGAAQAPLAPPAVPLIAVIRAPTPVQLAQRRASAGIVARPSRLQQSLDARRFVDQRRTHISARWMEGFYPIYAVAQTTFGVDWLLLASIHRQESAFSTAASTYHGLNFAACCAGPMQFNVTNRPVSTWRLVSDSYRYGARPLAYDHMTQSHPSIYDDFDAVMAAAHLLSADGAELALDGTAWNAAYDYYGHDATGVSYADEVLARAIGWSQHGFCVNCDVEAPLIEAVHAAYGAPVLRALATATAARASRR